MVTSGEIGNHLKREVVLSLLRSEIKATEEVLAELQRKKEGLLAISKRDPEQQAELKAVVQRMGRVKKNLSGYRSQLRQITQ